MVFCSLEVLHGLREGDGHTQLYLVAKWLAPKRYLGIAATIQQSVEFLGWKKHELLRNAAV